MRTADDAVHAMPEGISAFTPLEGWQDLARIILRRWLAVCFAETGHLHARCSELF